MYNELTKYLDSDILKLHTHIFLMGNSNSYWAKCTLSALKGGSLTHINLTVKLIC